MRTRAMPAVLVDLITPAGMDLVPTGFMTSTIRISPMPSATGYVEKSGRMQAVPVPALAARISMALRMFVLLLVLLLPLLMGFSLVQTEDLIVQRVADWFRPSGRSPIHSNTSRLHHSLREWRFGMTIQTNNLS